MEIVGAESTDLFIGSEAEPRQVVRVTVRGTGTDAGAGRLTVEASTIDTPEPAAVPPIGLGETAVVEVGIAVERGVPIDATVSAEAILRLDHEREISRRAVEVVVAEPGWRMYMVSHFHYDPVWWNTQAGYTETWGDSDMRMPFQEPGLALVKAHLDMARRDADYKFVLAELDYLKPYWAVYPEDRDFLRRLMAEGRMELMGGTYNEPNTNLTSAETSARSAVYGVAYQRDVLGGAPATAWQLDAFGHDPQFPGMMAGAGLTSSSWARGPFHEWGPHWVRGHTRMPALETHVDEKPRMQFSTEFDWVSPSGRGLLTSYMANHYSAGWWMDSSATLEEAEEQAHRLFTELRPLATTRNVLLPVGTDYTPPNKWVTEIHRDWNRRYVWPRFVCAIARDFFDAVRAERKKTGRGFSPQTRDMNPVYTGKDVSYIDTKQAHRAGENTLLDAEKFATLAALMGARFPAEAVDKAWRQLLFNAHHDGITGSESDQVYLDLLGGWREALELGASALGGALEHIGRSIDTEGPGRAVTAFNSLSWPHTDVVRLEVELPAGTGIGLQVADASGGSVPFVMDHVRRHDDGSLASCSLTFIAADVPATGYRTYRLLPAPSIAEEATWRAVPGSVIEDDRFRVEVDAARGGAITRLLDKRTRKEVLRPEALGDELLVYDEYPSHPLFGEGPWHLTPRGSHRSSAGFPAEVRVEESAIGRRIRAAGPFEDCARTHEITLLEGIERIEFKTRLDRYSGQDKLFRVRFGVAVEGGAPVSEVGNATIGRGFAFPNVDVATALFTLDNPAYNWFETGATARVCLLDPDGLPRASRAIGIAEVVAPGGGPTYDEANRELVLALVRNGVTSTLSAAGGSRYGTLDVDSNLPDVRIAIGSPTENRLTAALLEGADPRYAAELERQLGERGWARVWIPGERDLAQTWRPGVDVRQPKQLPLLIVAGRSAEGTVMAVRALAEDLGDSLIEVDQPAELDGGTGQVEDYGVALLNRGTPGFAVEADGSMYLSLLRSCTGWPSGIWIDPPARHAPDGSGFQLEHFSHTFEYALLPHRGDWRDGEVVRHGHDYNHPLIGRILEPHRGGLPAASGLLAVDPPSVVLTVLKPAGNPMARMAGPAVDPAAGIALRLYESAGRQTSATIRFLGPLRDVRRTDLIEEGGEELAVEDGVVHVELGPFEIATLHAVPQPFAAGHEGEPAADERDQAASRLDIGPSVELAPRAEAAQPVFADYWLHNRGAAPMGYQPVTVQIRQSSIVTEGPFSIDVLVASERTDDAAPGSVELRVPRGWRAAPEGRAYRLAPGAHLELESTITPSTDAPPGRYFVSARITDEAGQMHEDVVTVDLGPDPAEPVVADHRSPALADSIRRAIRRDALTAGQPGEELEARLLTPQVDVAPGERGELRVALRNRSRDEIRGEAQLIGPPETWPFTRPWTRGFTISAGGEDEIAFSVAPSANVEPGAFWALVKLMYFGRILYTESVAIEVRVAEAGAPTATVLSARD